VLAEPVMLALAAHVGNARARELVHAAALRGQEEGMSLREALAAEPAIAEHLDAARLDQVLDVESALGAVDALIDRALEP
jgi:adenylosuccinate lyase